MPKKKKKKKMMENMKVIVVFYNGVSVCVFDSVNKQ